MHICASKHKEPTERRIQNAQIGEMSRNIYCWLLFATALFGSGTPIRVTSKNHTTLRTWWHDNNDINFQSPVADDAVRRSYFYQIKVAAVNDSENYYDSFVYLSIPRSGRKKCGYTSDDGAEFSSETNLTMSWTSFQYSVDCWVYILSTKFTNIQPSDIIIRPSVFGLHAEIIDAQTVRVFVPYTDNGYRFSVEFRQDYYTAYNDITQGITGKLNNMGIGRSIHTEPQNALLIFANPIEPSEFAADADPSKIYYVPPGKVDNLDTRLEEIIYFASSNLAYWMPWNYHAKLNSNARAIYIEAGAYVKGAFQFLDDNQDHYQITGYGVLSGENYVYEPDTNNG